MHDRKGWATNRVRNLIVDHASGPSPTCEERNIADDEEWGLLKTTAVTWNGWDATAHKVPPKHFWGNRKIEVQVGDVLVTKAGPRNRCGVVVYIPDTPPRLMVSGKMILLRPDRSRVDPVFLASTLATEEIQRFLDSRTTGLADAQLNFTNQLLLDTEIEFPALLEQCRIAALRLALDEAIEQTEALIAKTQQIKAGLMHDLFTRGVTKNGELRPPRNEAAQLYKESPLGWIPKEWDFQCLSELTTRIVDGVHHTPTYVEHGVPFVTVKNLTASRTIDFSDLNYVSHQDHQKFLRRADPKPGDILVTKDGTLGISRLVEQWHPEFSIFVSVAMLRPIAARIRPQMLHLFFDCGSYERQLGRLSAGTGLKHIHLEHFRQFVIPLPAGEEQDWIWAVAEAKENRLLAEQLQLSKLRDLKRGLMHDLLTGRVRVPINASSTPA